MPYLYRHCLICFRKGEEDGAASDHVTRMANGEVTRRFCVLASRYLNLSMDLFKADRTIKTKHTWNHEETCASCMELLKSFCEVHNQLEYLKLQLTYRTLEIAERIKLADKEPESVQGKEELEKKMDEMASCGLEDVDEFRSSFVEKAKRVKTRWREKPQVGPIERGYGKIDDDDHDSDFDTVAVVVRDQRKRKRKKMVEDNISESQQVEDGHLLKSQQGVDVGQQVKLTDPCFSSRQKISIKQLEPASSTTVTNGYKHGTESSGSSPETAEDLKTRRTPQTDASQRPKISLNSGISRSLGDSDCSSDFEDVGPEDNQNEPTVKILNDKTNLMPMNTDDDECPFLNRQTGHEDVEPPKDWQQNNASKCSSLYSTSTGANQPGMSHLKYTCPLLNCQQSFTTMTRMNIHQRATGHFYHAIINIIPRN